MTILTPLQQFLRWEKEFPQKIFLRQPVNGRWITYSYSQAGDEIRRIAAALRHFLPEPKSKVAILSKNCAHWIMSDLAIMMAGHISVPIYPTLSASGIRPLLEHSGARLIFLGKLDHFNSQKPGLPDDIIKISYPHYGVDDRYRWDELLQQHAPIEDNAKPLPEDIATIMYSSGTTGTPKGIMLTHDAFGYVGVVVAENLKLTSNERFFSYLPLSHIAERALMEMVALACGGTISFSESLDLFVHNLQHEKPTIFGGVPRIYMKFQEGVMAKLPQKKLDTLLRIPVIRSIVRKKIQKGLGLECVKVIVCGAAPSPVAMLEWYHSVGLPIAEIYGMTENTAFSHANYDKVKIGSVGRAWPGVDVRLSTNNEIELRHPALMKGYYKDAETTASVMTDDGFMRTGDEGHIDDEGFLFITGRVKDQFKTDKGKFIAPGPLELQLLNDGDLSQVCVVGMGIPQPIALVQLSTTAKAKRRDELIQSLSVTLSKVNSQIEGYERIAKIIVMKDDWTQDNGLLTPSLKLKRSELEKIHLIKYPDWYRRKDVVIFE